MTENNKPTAVDDAEIRSHSLRVAGDILSAALSGPGASLELAKDLPSSLETVFNKCLSLLQGRDEQPAAALNSEPQKPAVNPKKSINDDFIICLEDGKKFKSLKRHLSSKYGLTPDAYRMKWNLPADYPMVAPNYAEERSRLAKEMGLGRGRAGKTAAPAKPVRKAA